MSHLVEQVERQSGEPRLGVGRGGPRQRDAEIGGLVGQFAVQIPDDLDVVGDKPHRTHHHCLHAGLRQHGKVIADIGFQPRNLRRAGARLPDDVVVVKARGRGDQACAVPDLPRIQAGSAAVHCAQRNRMGGEHQSGLVAQLLGEFGHSVGDRVGEHLDQQRVIEILPQFLQFRGGVTNRAAGPGDILLVLGAPRIPTPGRGAEDRRPADAVGLHLGHGVLDERVPVAVAEVDRQVLAAIAEFGADGVDEFAVDPVDR